MRNSVLAKIVAAATITIAFSVAARAQSESQTADKTAPAKKQKPAPKPTHKVWTEDNISTVRTQADAVIDSQDRQTVNSAAAVQEASEKQPVGDSSKSPAKKAPPLSQAKSAEDADSKIAWERRDIQGQEEYIASLEQRLASATPEERAHLQQIIEQHKQYIADSRKEMQGLEEQKKEFQNPKKPAAPAPAAPAPAAPATAPADSDSATSAESQPPSR